MKKTLPLSVVIGLKQTIKKLNKELESNKYWAKQLQAQTRKLQSELAVYKKGKEPKKKPGFWGEYVIQDPITSRQSIRTSSIPLPPTTSAALRSYGHTIDRILGRNTATAQAPAPIVYNPQTGQYEVMDSISGQILATDVVGHTTEVRPPRRFAINPNIPRSGNEHAVSQDEPF